jgi:hypothetical protein
MDTDKGKRSLRAKKFASGKPALEESFGLIGIQLPEKYKD